MHENGSFIPRPIVTPCFIVWSAFTTIHRSRRAVERGKPGTIHHMSVTSSGRGGWGPPARKFKHGRAELSTASRVLCNSEASNLAKCMMNSSMADWIDYRPNPPTSTSRTPDVIHEMNSPRPSPFSPPSTSVYYCPHKQVIHHHQSYHLCIFGMKNGIGLGMRLWNWCVIDGIISKFQLPGHCLALEWSRGKTCLYLCQLTTLLAYHSCPWTWLALATYHVLLSITQSVFM